MSDLNIISSHYDRVNERRRAIAPLAAAMWTFTAGCGLTGTWRTVAVEPKGAGFPIQSVTFDNSGRFTATCLEDEREWTSIGSYEWNGVRLTLDHDTATTRSYGARRTISGRLVLTDRTAEKTTKATLDRIAD